MQQYIIGIDPDSAKHGVAIYVDGVLDDLMTLELMGVYSLVLFLKRKPVELLFSIENVAANKAVWHGKSQSKAAYGMTSQNVAKCKQAQIELERMLDYLEVDYIHQKISKPWKKDKKQFELVTGWTGRSNEDTRSAAYFGWLGLK